MRWLPSRSSSIFLGVVLAVLGAAAPVHALEAYSVQLHIHGLSNHNAKPRQASMQWQSRLAQMKGLDVLWWTDHGFFTSVTPYHIPLAAGNLDPTTLTWENPGADDPDVAGPRYLVAQTTGGIPSAELRGRYLRWQLTNPKRRFHEFRYLPREVNDPKTLPKAGFPTALPAHPRLMLDLQRGPVGRDAYVRALVKLSWHYYQEPVQQSILYEFVDADARPRRVVVDDRQVVVRVPTSEANQAIGLDVWDDAKLLPDGEDNALQDFSFLVGSRNGSSAWARIGRVCVRSAASDVETVWRRTVGLAKQHEATYGVVQHVGFEAGGAVLVENVHSHFTLFFPEQRSFVRPEQYIDPRELCSYAHQRGGLLGYAHPFGLARGLLPEAEQDALLEQVARASLAERCFGADMIEVGYLRRGGCDLDHHLRLWDILTANGLYLCGTGVSDSHGSLGSTVIQTHPLVTWVWAQSSEAEQLIGGLRQRRAYFGNVYLYQGKLDVSLGPLKMGQAAIVSGDEADLRVLLRPRPAGQVLLVQGLMQPGLSVEYVHHRTPIDPSQPIRIDTSRPCFVRVEVFSPQGDFLVASNPILCLKEPRIELVQQVFRIVQGEPARIRWRVAGAPKSTCVWWRIEDAALGQTTPGGPCPIGYLARLPVTDVPAGKRIRYRLVARWPDRRVVWPPAGERALAIEVTPSGPTPAAAPPFISQLSTVPAGGGAEIAYCLSAAASVRVEVLNVAGRRVATVASARPCGPGLTRLQWDRRGDRGERVPAGRYLVRVSLAAPAGATHSAISGLQLPP